SGRGRQAQGGRARARHLVQASPEQRGAGWSRRPTSIQARLQAVCAAHGSPTRVQSRQGSTARGGLRRRGDRPQARTPQVKIVVATLLLYPTGTASPRPGPGGSWLERRLSGAETVAFAWLVLLAFVRLSTNPRVFERPLSADRAFDVVARWLGQP